MQEVGQTGCESNKIIYFRDVSLSGMPAWLPFAGPNNPIVPISSHCFDEKFCVSIPLPVNLYAEEFLHLIRSSRISCVIQDVKSEIFTTYFIWWVIELDWDYI